jgi:hypothetical protein
MRCPSARCESPSPTLPKFGLHTAPDNPTHLPGCIALRGLARRITDMRADIKVLYMSGHTDSTIVDDDVMAPFMAIAMRKANRNDLARLKSLLERA